MKSEPAHVSGPRVEARSLACAYAANGRRPVLHEVNLALRAGELVGLIGPNGAGKTTLMRALRGFLPALRGDVLLNGRHIKDLSPREIARSLAWAPQSAGMAWPYSVEQIVRLGRTPHRGWFMPFNREDALAVARALARMDLEALFQRPFHQLSGGEQRRVLIARALAQEPDALLLDEPTANLDINHQHQVLDLVRRLVKDEERPVAALVSIHDLGLAARYCDRLLLLHQGRVRAKGDPAAVLQPDHLEAVFGVRTQLYRDPGGHWAITAEPPVR